MSQDWREVATTIVASLLSRPLVLTAWIASLGVVIAGASLFVFLIKGGAVAIMVRGERKAGPVEQPPLLLPDVIATASALSVDQFVESARALFPRFARLGLALMGVYLASGAIYVIVVSASWSAGLLVAFTVVFVAWITIVNFLYLLMQIVIVADDCSIMSAFPRVSAFLRRERRLVAAVFLVVLALVLCATSASLVATAALGLIAFIPLFGLTVLPLQLLAWMLRDIVFQYIGLSSIAAYVTLYRDHARTSLADARVRGTSRARAEPDRAVNAAEMS